jgi:hypothetical protein
LIKITERKFQHQFPGSPALLRQRMFLVVREPDITFPESDFKSGQGNFYFLQMPFRRVRLTTLVTPNLDPPGNSDFSLSIGNNPGADRTGQSVFWPQVNQADFQFHLVGEDRDGQVAEFTAPLLFVSTERNLSSNPILLTSIQIDYEKTGPEARRLRPLNGQRVAFTRSQTLGDTTFETNEITLGVEIPDQATFNRMGSDLPRFYPVVRQAGLIVPALKHIAGLGRATQFRFNEVYLKNGLGGSQNPGEVYLELPPSQSLALSFNQQGDRSGGLVKPNMQVKGLSRLTGPVAGPSGLGNITAGKFDPQDFFDGADAKLFGVINLFELLKAASLPDLDKMPVFKTESQTSVQVLLEDLDGLAKDLAGLNTQSGLNQAALSNIANLSAAAGSLQTLAANLIATLPALPDDTARNQLQMALSGFKAALEALNASLKGLPGSEELKNLQKSTGEFNADLADPNQYAQRLLAALQTPDEVKASFEWRPDLHDWPAEGGALFVASDGDKTASVVVSASVRASTNFKASPQVDISCVMRDFKLDLIGSFESFIIVHFKKLKFQSGGGKKADVDVDLGQVEFVGVLSFVETLKKLIPLNGFSDPPDLQVTRQGIISSYSVGLPNIGFGVFSLENLSLSAKLTIPFFTDPLSFRFNFCERHSPFLLTVAFFGGGGFFGLTVDPGGVQTLEAAFEFGASISIDFGIASGGVHVLGGIYYKMERVSGKFRASLTGYFRMGGEVSVLGIISVSIELYLSLTYEFSSGKCSGKATLTLEVHIIFFSISVEVSVERKFAGSNGDPGFAQLMAPYPDPFDPAITVDPWVEYCQAFA